MPLKKVLVVVFGRRRAGKNELVDAIAGRLREHAGYSGASGFDPVARRSFADAIKAGAAALLGIPADLPDELKEDSRFVGGRSARYVWQKLGTEFGRDLVHPDVWPLRLARAVGDSAVPFHVVSDGRFENELTVPRTELPDRVVVFNVLVRRPSLPPEAGRPPTRFWRVLARLGFPVRLIHRSEYEPAELERRQLAGEELFDCVVDNDSSLDRLRLRGAAVADLVFELMRGGNS